MIYGKLLTLLWLPVAVVTGCPRDKSRVVRMVVSKKIQPVYEEYGVTMPRSCPLMEEYDTYGEQERMKTQEHPSRWLCGFCGKAFYEEHFLDVHFENRHAEFVRQGPDTVCLAQFCDVFRCEVVGQYKKPKYWDKAMCKEEKLAEYKTACKKLMKTCRPEELHGIQLHEFEEKLLTGVCDVLTCDRYWDPLDPELDPTKLAAYIVACMLLIIGLFIYYFVVYTHYYTEDPFFESERRRLQQHRHHNLLRAPENCEIRNRFGTR